MVNAIDTSRSHSNLSLVSAEICLNHSLVEIRPKFLLKIVHFN